MIDQPKPESRKALRYRTDPEFKRKHLEGNKRYRCLNNRPEVKARVSAEPTPPKRTWVGGGWGYLGNLQGQVNIEHKAGGL